MKNSGICETKDVKRMKLNNITLSEGFNPNVCEMKFQKCYVNPLKYYLKKLYCNLHAIQYRTCLLLFSDVLLQKNFLIIYKVFCPFLYQLSATSRVRPVHCRKRLPIFPSPAGMSLAKLSLVGKNLINPGQGGFGYWHPGWGGGDGKIANLFSQCIVIIHYDEKRR